MGKGRSRCGHGEVCLYGTSVALPLPVVCGHSAIHRQDGGCNKGHLCWRRYVELKTQVCVRCEEVKKERRSL